MGETLDPQDLMITREEISHGVCFLLQIDETDPSNAEVILGWTVEELATHLAQRPKTMNDVRTAWRLEKMVGKLADHLQAKKDPDGDMWQQRHEELRFLSASMNTVAQGLLRSAK